MAQRPSGVAALRIGGTLEHLWDTHARSKTDAACIPDTQLTVWDGCGHLDIVAHWPEVVGS